MENILILGLGPSAYAPDYPSNVQMQGWKVWTCNQWWSAYHGLNPDRVYQVHEDFLDKWAGRPKYKGWRKRYARVGEVRSVVDMGLANQRIIDIGRLDREYGPLFLGSSLAFMAVDALEEKVKEIQILGFPLKADGEYEYQRPSAIRNVEAMRMSGANVDCADYQRWKASEEDVSSKFHGCFMESMRYGSRECMRVIDRMIDARTLKTAVATDFEVR